MLGFLFTGFGVACLVGPPLAGVMVDYTHDYKWPVFVAAASAVIGLIAVLPIRQPRLRRRLLSRKPLQPTKPTREGGCMRSRHGKTGVL